MTTPPHRQGIVTHATTQGGRSHQEDRYVEEWIDDVGGISGWLLAVFDGHRSAETSALAADQLVPLFKYQLETNSVPMTALFETVFATLRDLTVDHLSGSTASIAFISADAQEVTIGVLGDSPIAILDAQGQMFLGADHNVRTNLQERSAAEERGGVYREGYLEDRRQPGTGLQMGRALGDRELDRILSRSPDIQTIPLGGRGIVMVGSDGLLVPLNPLPSQLRTLLSLIQQGGSADVVVQNAMTRAIGDNITALVWKA